MSRTFRASRVAMAVTAVALLCAPAAQATFPGENGRLAFSSYRDGKAGIWTMKPDGTDPQLLVAGWASSPAWAPHGQQVAFIMQGRAAIVDADGSDLFYLTPAGSHWVNDVAWAPDGLKLVFSRSDYTGYGGGSDLFTVNVDGTGLTRITNTPTVSESSPDWSPDGKRIAYAGSGFSWSEYYYWSNDIQTIAPDGSDRRNVTSGSYNSSPSWSPDGTRIVFMNQSSIASTKADGSDYKDYGFSGQQPVWSPDGEHIAFSRYSAYPNHTSAIALIDDVNGALTTLSLGADYDTDPSWQPLPEGYPSLGPVDTDPDEAETPVKPPVTLPKPPAVNVQAALVAYINEILSGSRGPLVRIGIQGLSKVWWFEPLVPAPGAVSVEITEDRKTALAAAAGKKVIARGSATATSAGRLKVKVRPTKSGRKILRGKKRIRLRVKMTYKATGFPAASSSVPVTLKRR